MVREALWLERRWCQKGVGITDALVSERLWYWRGIAEPLVYERHFCSRDVCIREELVLEKCWYVGGVGNQLKSVRYFYLETEKTINIKDFRHPPSK